MADAPEDGGRPTRGTTASGVATARPSSASPLPREVQYEELSSDFSETPTPTPGSPRARPSLKSRITRPSFLIDLVQGTPVGEYEIEAQIGEGAMGTVFSAIHPLIGKKVAIKVLKPELCANQASLDRFVQEAQAVNKIGHPNIVDVFMLAELDDGRFYFVMEWLRGDDLKTRLARGPLTILETCDVLDGIARALEAAHAKEIVHRDLKPDNVFLHVVEDGHLQVKLLDFGIAKLVRQTPGTEKTQTGNMLGTPKYISPEQARGVQVDHRSDIYSLGVMAYEMLAGRPPFDGETAMDLVVKHLHEAPPPLSQFAKIPKALEQCVMRMLAKDPELRPRLEEVRATLIDPTRRLTPIPGRMSTMSSAYPTPAAPPARRRWPIFVVAAVAAAGLGVLSWKLVDGSKDGDDEHVVTMPVVAPTPPPPPAAPPPPPPAPAETAPPPPARSMLFVDVAGSKDAEVFVDGREWGRGASIKIELEPGGHDVVIKPPGRPALARHVELEAGQPTSVKIVVPPAPGVGRPASHPNKAPRTTPKIAPKDDDDLMKPKGH